MDIQGITQNQLLQYCHTSQAEPALWIMWIASILIFVISYLIVADLSKTNISKLIVASIVFTIFTGIILFFLINSPVFITKFV